MPAPRKGLRNIKTMTNKAANKVHSSHDAFIGAAALHREKQRHLQELAILHNRLNELTLRLEQISAEQAQLAESFDMPNQTIIPTARSTFGTRATPSLSQGFKIKY